MLTLSKEQWKQLQSRDDQQFTATVCDQYLASHPDMAQTPGREVVLNQMRMAREFADRLGFTDAPHIVQLMYLLTEAPALIDNPRFASHLRKPGATPEQRLDDLFAVMKYKLKGEASIWPH
jgi:hypothetical protein